MNYLLDTHIWVRTQLEPNRLSRRVQRVVSDPRSELWLSPISVVEFGMLHRKHRFTLEESPSTWLPKAILGIHEAVTTHEIALLSQRYLGAVKDPADRVIAATAAVYRLCLITADGELAGLKDIEILDNSD
jgi:PIN domain nuclease of toxin-antitoxin system